MGLECGRICSQNTNNNNNTAMDTDNDFAHHISWLSLG